MRGKGQSTAEIVVEAGITPAYAGKRNNNTPAFPGLEDHPRVCGEKFLEVVQPIAQWRITPAYAGKRPRLPASCLKPSDHPRVCGEKSAGQAWVRPARGSPPRMRGKGGRYPINMSQVGITPAYAGKRSQLDNGAFCAEDHPRVCGEKTGAPWRWLMVTGSPPRMRGKDQALKYAVKGARITPAYAGKRRRTEQRSKLS